MKGQVSWFERMAFLAAHPVGEYFWTSSAENPGDRYGGTWGQIKDVFLLAAGDSYAAGSTGGEAEHTLLISEMPSHRHSITTTNNTGTISNPGNVLKLPSGYGAASDGTGFTMLDLPLSGDGKSHNNMPPYRTAYCWQRTA